jgi:hypothetical protein
VACSLNTKKDRLSLHGAVKRWRDDIEASRDFWRDPRYLEVRYEDLVIHTEPTLKKVLHFIEEPWDDRVLDYYQVDRDLSVPDANEPNVGKPLFTSSMGRWKEELSDNDLKTINEAAGYLLKELGYS